MNARISKISRALHDLAQASDAVLRVTGNGVAALRGKDLSNSERCLLEDRIDGFRSLEQVLSISGDLVGLHAALGKLVALGLVAVEGDAEIAEPVAAKPAKPAAAAPVSPAPPQPPVPNKPAIPVARVAATPPRTPTAPQPAPAAPLPAKAAVARTPTQATKSAPAAPAAKPSEAAKELAQAKALLRVEAGYLFGDKAPRVIARVYACKSVEEIFDVIVKLQGLLAKSGKADPNVFIDRLTTGLSKLRDARQKGARAPA
jgi:hypothetical protein